MRDTFNLPESEITNTIVKVNALKMEINKAFLMTIWIELPNVHVFVGCLAFNNAIGIVELNFSKYKTSIWFSEIYQFRT